MVVNRNFSRLSIVIPCYNEKNTIEKVLQKIYSVNLPLEKEVIIVDDYSTDGTREIIKKLETSNPKIKTIYNKTNRGKGFSLRQGFSKTSGDIIIIQDADLEYEPSDYSILIEPIINYQSEVVFGSRFIGEQPDKFFFISHYVGNKFLTFVSNLFTGLSITDMETCYKVFTREILSKIRLKEDRFGFEPEFTAQIGKLKCQVIEVPITYRSRSYLEGKKITWKDGIKALYIILKYGLKN